MSRSPHVQPQGSVRERLSVLYSHSAWQVDEYLDRLGESETDALLAAHNRIPPLWAHVNPLCGSLEELQTALARESVNHEIHPWLPDCLALHGAGDLEGLRAHKQGLFIVADPAARLSVLAANPQPGMRVIDGCAAPGGKSFMTAMAMKNRGEIIAFDIHPHKLKLLREGCGRLGLTAVKPGLKDAGVFDPALERSADLVIADLPCSGLGVVRKKPDIRYKTQAEVAGLPTTQLRLLSNLSRYVKLGGMLLHVTCTLRIAENENVSNVFLQENRDFHPLPFTLPDPIGHTPEGRVTLWPHRFDTDGFFIALYQRT